MKKGNISAGYRGLKASFDALLEKYRWLPHVLAALLFMVAIFYYMTPQVLHPTTTVYGFGDNTAGPIWRYQVSPHAPFWGHENVTNYPYGESLSSPVNYSGSVQYVSYWLLAKAFGPILAYNLFNMLGLLLTAMVMYGFIYSLTRRRYIAWLAGYAVAFSPYYQMKIGGHPTYAYQAVFIGLIWLFCKLLKYKRKRDAVYLGLLTAVSFYLDPYFVLLAMTVLVPLTLVWAGLNPKLFRYSFWKQKTKNDPLKHQFKLLTLTAGVLILCLLPLLTILYTQGSQINNDVAAARGNVLAEAKACSNWPHEYLVPFVLNPVFETAFSKVRYASTVNFLRDNFSCGIGEDSIGLSLTLLSVVALVGIVLVWERVNRRNTGLYKLITINPRFLLLGVGAIGLVAIAIGFPPLRFHHIPTPSYLLLSITSTWRTLARVYVLVNIALIILASISLTYLAHHFSKNKRFLAIGFAVIFLGVLVEYQAFTPFKGNTLSTYNYREDTPSAYTWLAKDSAVKVVAEYPLEREGGESDAGSYYLTMQSTHQKKLFNSALSNSSEDVYESGIKNIADPQTIPVLRAMGVDTIVVHGVSAEKIRAIPYTHIIYTSPQAAFNLLSHTPTVKVDNIVIVDIKDTPKATSVLSLGKGFARNGTIIQSAADWQYEAVQDSRLTVSRITNQRYVKNNTPQPVCLEVKMSVPTEVTNLTLRVDGQDIAEGTVTGQFAQFRVDAINQVVLHAGNGHNMRVTNIGCTL